MFFVRAGQGKETKTSVEFCVQYPKNADPSWEVPKHMKKNQMFSPVDRQNAVGSIH